MSALYRFGPFILDSVEGTLARNGNPVKLQDLPFRLLLLLLENSGQVISRESVRQRLWPENTFVEFDSSLGVAVRKIREALGDSAEAPIYVETLPRRGYRFRAPVVVVGAELALGHAVDLRDKKEPSAHQPSFVTSSSNAASPQRSKRQDVMLRFAVAGGTLFLIAAVFYGVHSTRKAVANAATTVSPSKARIRPSIAVIGFRNLPGHPEDNWLSSAFAEMLSTELGADGSMRIIPGEDVARAKREMPLADEDSLGKESLERLHKNSGADIVVLGSYTPLPGKGEKRIRLDVRLQDTARGETISEKAFVGNENDLFELVGKAGISLRQSMGTRPPSEEASAEARAGLPTDPLAVKLFTEAQAHLWSFDFIHARDLLIQAISVEPDFPLAHASLSEAWSHLGYALKARDEAERARTLSSHLGAEERLQIDGQYYASLSDTNNAIAVYQKLFSQFPDNLNYGLRLADEQRKVNSQEALKTLSELRRLPSPAPDDPRIDMLEARAWINKDYAKAQAAGRRAVEKGKAESSPLLVARAYGILCQTMGNGASTEQAIEDCENARRGYAAAGDRNNEARTLSDFAGLYYQLGQMDRAEGMFREAIKVFRDLGSLDGLTTASSNLGDVYLSRGNLAGAQQALSDALPGYKEMGDKDGVALTLNDLAELARHRGELENSLRMYDEAKTAAQEIDDKTATGYVLSGRGETLYERGDLFAARGSYEQSLAIRKQTGEKQTAAETVLALARLAIEEGHTADAESVIRKCKDQFHQDQQADDELSASVALIHTLLAESKFPEAEDEVALSNSLAANSGNKILKLRFNIAAAKVEGASGKPASAIAHLQALVKDANLHHLLDASLEARLAMLEVEKKSVKPGEVQSEAASLERSARSSGFDLIATKAAKVRSAGN